MVQFNLARGALVLPSAAEPYLLARALAQHLEHFFAAQTIAGNDYPAFESFAAGFWHLMVPWMSAAGLEEYLLLLQRKTSSTMPPEPDFS